MPAILSRPEKLPKPSKPCWCDSGKKYSKCHQKEDVIELNKVLKLEGLIRDAYSASSNEATFELMSQAAETGSIQAQLNVGDMIRAGQGTARNLEQAVVVYTKAADQGNANAQYGVGRMHLEGEGTPKSSAKALEWLTKSAVQGHADAQNSCGTVHFMGGTAEDHAKALKWFRKAVAQEHIGAMQNLGSMLLDGIGCSRDPATAMPLIERAARAGNEGAKITLSKIALNTARMGGDEIAKGKAEKAALQALKSATGAGMVDELDSKMHDLKLRRTCDACGKTEEEANVLDSDKLRFCGNCKLAKYCSPKCMSVAWPTHQAACDAEVARKAKAEAED